MVVIMVVVMMVMVVIAPVGQLPQLLLGDLAVVEGDDKKGPGLSEMPGNRLAVVGGDCNFDSHNKTCE
jgi:hypothetical protein